MNKNKAILISILVSLLSGTIIPGVLLWFIIRPKIHSCNNCGLKYDNNKLASGDLEYQSLCSSACKVNILRKQNLQKTKVKINKNISVGQDLKTKTNSKDAVTVTKKGIN